AAAHCAVRYVGRIIDGRRDFEVTLYHRLPQFLPELREHGGSEDPDRETELGRELSRLIAAWVSGLSSEFLPTLDKLKNVLLEARLTPGAIAYCIDKEVFPGEDLAGALRRVARERDCNTIALAREHLPGIQEFFAHHTSDDLVREGTGIAVWVIE
ncbi:MAG: hypothetical protein WB783_03575, partial [Arenicellales bacterium]